MPSRPAASNRGQTLIQLDQGLAFCSSMIFFRKPAAAFGIMLTDVALGGAPFCFGWMSGLARPVAFGVARLPRLRTLAATAGLQRSSSGRSGAPLAMWRTSGWRPPSCRSDPRPTANQRREPCSRVPQPSGEGRRTDRQYCSAPKSRVHAARRRWLRRRHRGRNRRCAICLRDPRLRVDCRRGWGVAQPPAGPWAAKSQWRRAAVLLVTAPQRVALLQLALPSPVASGCGAQAEWMKREWVKRERVKPKRGEARLLPVRELPPAGVLVPRSGRMLAQS